VERVKKEREKSLKNINTGGYGIEKYHAKTNKTKEL